MYGPINPRPKLLLTIHLIFTFYILNWKQIGILTNIALGINSEYILIGRVCYLKEYPGTYFHLVQICENASLRFFLGGQSH